MFNSSGYPEQLEWPLNLIEDYTAIIANDLNVLAKKYFQPEKTAAIKIVPAAIETQDKEVGKAVGYHPPQQLSVVEQIR